MADLIVLAFDTEDGAVQAREKLFSLQKQQLIQLSDAAVVVRRTDGKVKVKQAHNLVGSGVLGGAFWGLLIGIIFWMPWLGLLAGAAGGALGGAFTDIGIDDSFIKDVGNTVQPGHSALFLLVTQIVEDKVLPELQHYQPTVLRTNLSSEDEAKLKEAFGATEIED